MAEAEADATDPIGALPADGVGVHAVDCELPRQSVQPHVTMLENNPERNIRGLGRHCTDANFFWYLKDPDGNFSEYYSDMDTVPGDELWSPEVLHGLRGLYAWDHRRFLEPDDSRP